jgi:hypothetical protein
METLRLRNIQQPSRVERLLEAFVARGYFLPQDCYQLRNPATLSPKLRGVVIRETEKGRVWGCWVNTFQIWLFIAEMSLPLSRERGAPVLLVNLYDEAGELKDAGTWMSDPHGEWRRCVE